MQFPPDQDQAAGGVAEAPIIAAALERVPCGFSVWNENLELLLYNRQYLALQGIQPAAIWPGISLEELCAISIAAGNHPGARPEQLVEAYRALAAQAQPGKPARHESRVLGRTIRTTVERIEGIGLFSAHEDVTEDAAMIETLQSREMELQHKHRSFEAALENMPQGVGVYDAELRLIFCNRHYRELYGLPEELSRPGTQLRAILEWRAARGVLPDEGGDAYVERVIEIGRSGGSDSHLLRFPDGRTVSVYHRPLPDGGIVASHRDITEEVKALEALQAREAELESSNLRFSAAINNITHGLIMFGPDQRVIICNAAYARIYDLPTELAKPGTMLEQIIDHRTRLGMIKASDRDQVLKHWQDVGRSGQPHDEIVELGDGRAISLVHRPMKNGGWVAVHEDITERRRAESALAESESRWKFALEGAGQGVWDADIVHGKMFYSPQWKVIRGFDPEQEVKGDREEWLARVHPDDRERIRQTVEAQDRGDIPMNSFAYRERHQKDGHWVWIASRGRPIAWQADGRPARVIGTDTDITKEKELELKLEANLELLHTTFENYPGGICLVDRNMVLSVANANYYAIFEIDQAEFPTGASLEAIVRLLAERGHYGSGDVEALVADRMQIARSTGQSTYERSFPDGRIIQFKRSPLPSGGFVQTMEDITEQRRNEERIRYLARHDPLTDLPNRMRFLEEMNRVEAGIGRGEKVAVICLDLDRFKTINDTLGHAAGDAVLKHVGDMLSSVLREGDLAARLGGDEFAILAKGIEEPAHAANIASRIVALLNKPIEIDGHRVMVGASIGIAVAPHDGVDTDALMKNADLALYRAKSEGRGAYHFFEKGMDAALQRRRLIEAGLKEALANQAFRLVYQPIFNLKDLKILGFEALLRWRSPEGEDIGPTEFIPVAEETGLIIPIGEWVLREACKAAASWPSPVGVAVNLSPVQFRARNLTELVKSALEDAGLEPGRLELEITESLLLLDTAQTLDVLHQLRALGVRISMDDFGTGYSSLSYFRSFPFDKIKIDRSFISELGVRKDNLAIITAVIGLSRSLGMTTTAEGIETEEQMRLVRAEGCEEAQGFLFSPPLPASAVAGLLGADANLAQPRQRKAIAGKP